jgi:hypothetical protein
LESKQLRKVQWQYSAESYSARRICKRVPLSSSEDIWLGTGGEARVAIEKQTVKKGPAAVLGRVVFGTPDLQTGAFEQLRRHLHKERAERKESRLGNKS